MKLSSRGFVREVSRAGLLLRALVTARTLGRFSASEDSTILKGLPLFKYNLNLNLRFKLNYEYGTQSEFQHLYPLFGILNF